MTRFTRLWCARAAACLLAAVVLAVSPDRSIAAVTPLVAGDGPADSVRVTISVNDTLGNAANADTVVLLWTHKGVKFDSMLTTTAGYRTGQYVFVHKASNAGSSGDYQVLVRACVSGRTPVANFAYQVIKGGLIPLSAITDSNLARAVTADSYKADLSACGAGNGAVPCTLFVMKTAAGDTTSLQGVFVRVYNAAETATAATGTTNPDGRVIFALEAATFHVYAYQGGYRFSPQPDTITIGIGGLSDTIWATSFDPGLPATVSLCRVYGWVKNLAGDTLPRATIQARVSQSPLRYGNLVISPYEMTAVTDSTGYWYLDLFPSSVLTPDDTRYEFTIRFSSGAILRRKLAVPDSTQWLLTW